MATVPPLTTTKYMALQEVNLICVILLEIYTTRSVIISYTTPRKYRRTDNTNTTSVYTYSNGRDWRRCEDILTVLYANN